MYPTPDTLTDLIYRVTDLIQLAIPILIALALFFFMWSLMTMLLGGVENKDELKKARNRMLWGVIVLFILLSVGGILAVVENTFFRTSSYQGGQYGTYNQGYWNRGTSDYIYESGGRVLQKAPANEFSFCLFNSAFGINCPQPVGQRGRLQD